MQKSAQRKRLRSKTLWPGEAEFQRTSFGGLNRSELMSRVRSRDNATTELKMRSLLKQAGLTGWRRHLPLPGKPDFAWPREKVAVFIDGCFWHGHNCRSLTPRTNTDAWREKIASNKRRDQRAARSLRGKGWFVMRVWECRLNSQGNAVVGRLVRALNGHGG